MSYRSSAITITKGGRYGMVREIFDIKYFKTKPADAGFVLSTDTQYSYFLTTLPIPLRPVQKVCGELLNL